jgi:succinate-acetate transporter protein
MKRKYAAGNTEAVQMVFVLLLVAFLVLAVTAFGSGGKA